MPRLPLLGGSYSARSIIANCQRCINLYPERNSQDAPVPLTHYQRPGFRALVQGPSSPVRGLYQASNGNGYAVIGQNVYAVGQGWSLTLLGKTLVAGGNPVSMIDNGTTLLLVDNSPYGYTIDLGTNAFAQFVDPTGLFTGATRVDTIDTFTLWNMPGSRNFGSTLSNTLTIDPTYIAGKVSYPDTLQTLIVNRHEMLLLGTLKSEIWYNAGGANFPFAQLPGAYIEHGCVAPYSVAAQDIEVYWLGKDLQGQGVVFRQRGYDTVRISNHALEFAIRQMSLTVGIGDAIGYCWQQDGHVFYSLTFPAGNQTWVWDASIGEPMIGWHQSAWADSNGALNRDRSNCFAALYGKNVVGDWENGTIYELDPEYYYDDWAGNPGPIPRIRTFPHIGMGNFPLGIYPDGIPMQANGQRLMFTRFVADLECGNGPLGLDGLPAQVGLRWSDDRGKTFGNEVLQSSGAPGEWLTQPLWRQLGIARDRIFELSYSFAGEAALNGAYIDVELLDGD